MSELDRLRDKLGDVISEENARAKQHALCIEFEVTDHGEVKGQVNDRIYSLDELIEIVKSMERIRDCVTDIDAVLDER